MDIHIPSWLDWAQIGSNDFSLWISPIILLFLAAGFLQGAVDKNYQVNLLSRIDRPNTRPSSNVEDSTGIGTNGGQLQFIIKHQEVDMVEDIQPITPAVSGNHALCSSW